LAQRFGGQVIGIDPSERMLQQARRKPNSGNISYCEASAEALPLSDDRNQFDYLHASEHAQASLAEQYVGLPFEA
jgi:ubiquinone/menaquinone biosynthesis C-methylase UbiE